MRARHGEMSLARLAESVLLALLFRASMAWQMDEMYRGADKRVDGGIAAQFNRAFYRLLLVSHDAT